MSLFEFVLVVGGVLAIEGFMIRDWGVKFGQVCAGERIADGLALVCFIEEYWVKL